MVSYCSAHRALKKKDTPLLQPQQMMQLAIGWHVQASIHSMVCMYVNNKMLQGLRPERGMLKKVLFAAGKIYQENNQSHL